MNDYDDIPPACPACYSDTVVRITEDEKNESLAYYDLYDFIGRIDIMTCNYKCTNCGHQW